MRNDSFQLEYRDGPAGVADALAKSPVCEAPPTFDIATRSAQLTFEHWDPADRCIVATAQPLDATLIEEDERLIVCPHVRVLVNR